MANYSDLYVIGEESENDLRDDINQNELYIRFNSANINESALINQQINFGDKEQDIESDSTSKKVASSVKMRNRDSNFQNDTDRRRSSGKTSITRTKTNIFEPTYRMDPKPDQYFVWYKVRNLINKMIIPLFENFTYNSRAAGNFCKMICNKSVSSVKKKFDWPRYRYICHVTLFQLNQQGVVVADRSLKYADTDNCAVSLFRKKDCVMVVTFYGIYLE